MTSNFRFKFPKNTLVQHGRPPMITRMKLIQQRCTLHSSQDLDIFCKNCGIGLCSICMDLGAKNDGYHDMNYVGGLFGEDYFCVYCTNQELQKLKKIHQEWVNQNQNTQF